MLPAAALRKVLNRLPRKPLHGPWYRAVNFDHLAGPPPGTSVPAPQPLWPGGAARSGARFTPRSTTGASAGTAGAPIDCLYLAEDELTPLMEIAGVLRPAGSKVRLVFEPQVLMTVDGSATDILDLTDVSIQTALGTTYTELTGGWVVQQALFLKGLGSLPPTQLLGMEAFIGGQIVGLRYPSSKNPRGVGLVIFTARLRARKHRMAISNQPGGILQQSLP